MKFKLIFAVTCGVLTACSGSGRHRDISDLEKPPVMAIVKQNPVETARPSDEAETRPQQPLKRDGLSGLATVIESGEHSALRIKGSFERSWELVGRALQLGRIQVNDKNREKGTFRVTYDPDLGRASQGGKDFLTSIFSNEYPEAEYELSLNRKDDAVLILAERLNPKTDPQQSNEAPPADDDNELEDYSPKVGENHLINRLHTIIKDEFLK